MKTREFCEFAATKLVKDFVEAEIITDGEAFGVRFVICGALEAAVQHALMGVRSALDVTMRAADLMPDDDDFTEKDLIAFIEDSHPHA